MNKRLYLTVFVLLSIIFGIKGQGPIEGPGSITPEVLTEDAIEAFESEDYEKAYRLISRAAAKGHPRAQGILGYFYLEGIGTSKNVIK